MRDALGHPQTCLLVGGTSEIGLAAVRALATGGRLRRVVLAGRNRATLEAAGDRLRDDLGVEVAAVEHDVRDTERAADVVATAVEWVGDLDVAIVAAGVLGDQERYERDPSAAVDAALTNYVGPMAVALHVAARLRDQGHGTLVVLSSVAGDRPRRSNFVYGSTKAGLDALATGLGDALAGSGARVVVVRPGFVRTRMTEGLDPAPLATDADTVGEAIAQAVRSGDELVYVPAPLRYVMAGLRSLPRAAFRRLPL